MKRKDYQMPTTKIVDRQMQTLLSVSGNATMNVTYTEEDWDE